ncbi:DNA polymerase IV [Cryomorpha ignava]|uniref:DNA polymerase IV n=2 Tax=Cryomorpha ignava TaxID=101383 RepID=A0A7K3WUA4_9FLAO|nr:DNA polymerase IV [Cryomorpha ignava]
MDAFFASVEQRDNPDLRGKPVAVGGSRERGVVAAASYEARVFGVKSAMPSSIAARRCPNLIFVPPRFEVYREVSQKIRAIFYAYTDLIEPLSLDEAFLDVTQNKRQMTSATDIAREIRQRIFDETGLTASAGISVNKFIAKVASDINKPNGQKLIHPTQIDAFTANLEIKRFFGIGKVTAGRLNDMGIHTGADLRKYTRPELVQMFGKSGSYYYHICRGLDDRPVRPDRIRKSVGAERTYSEDLSELDDQQTAMRRIAEEVSKRMKQGEHRGKTITVKLRYSDFTTHTRSRSLDHFTDLEAEIYAIAADLLEGHPREQALRLLGISVSKLDTESRSEGGQLTLDF